MDIQNRALRQFLELTGLTTEAGELERRGTAIQFLVPGDCEIEGDRLLWSPGFLHAPPQDHLRFQKGWLRDPKKFLAWRRRLHGRQEAERAMLRATSRVPGPRMLSDFVALASGSDDEILSYARTWGPLCICEHGLPCSHSFESCGPMRLDRRRRKHVYWEPLASWRHFAEQALAILALAGLSHSRDVDDPGFGQLMSHTPPNPFPLRPVSAQQAARREERDRKWVEEFNLWLPLMQQWIDQEHPELRRPRPLSLRLQQQRRAVAYALNRWIELGAVRPIASWEQSEPSLEITAGTYGNYEFLNDRLFGALTMEFTYAVLRRSRMRRCDGCGRPHVPRRWPKLNSRSFCRTCGKRASWRLSKRRARETRAEE